LNLEHAHLAFASIGALWTNVANSRSGRRIVGHAEMGKNVGGTSTGRWGKARAEQQIAEWFGTVPDFILTFDADYATTCSDAEFCVLTEHELMHCGQAKGRVRRAGIQQDRHAGVRHESARRRGVRLDRAPLWGRCDARARHGRSRGQASGGRKRVDRGRLWELHDAAVGEGLMAVEVKVGRRFDALRITINGILHLSLTRSKLLGVQSWINEREQRFVIEYTMRGGTILCDYDSREKWASILEQLGELL
jgi:hypothetical protein